MAKNEFLPFGIAEGANVLSNQEYERLAARFNGFVSGVAKSKELNTVWRQSSVMSSALAQFIVDSDNKDLLDNGDIASIKTRLVAAIKQTISGVGYVTTAAMNLELNKKIDKASISGVLGNDNSKVPSLSLLTTELGKKQPAGDYATKTDLNNGLAGKQPAGDYATNAALNNGLGLKFDKAGGTTTGNITVPSFTVRNPKVDLWLNFYPASSSEIGNYAYFQYGNSSGTGGRVGIPRTAGSEMFMLALSGDSYNKSESNNLFANKTVTQLQQFNSIVSGRRTIQAENNSLTFGLYIDPVKGAFLTGMGDDGNHYGELHHPMDGKIGTIARIEDFNTPVGMPIPWPQATAPAGYLICNGQWFNKTAYPLLTKAYPSGQLPDLRGEFIRGLDAGRNIDSGRAVLSAQGDAIRNITGEMSEANDRMINFSGAFYDGGFVGGSSGLSGGRAGHKVRFDASRVVPTANENRPRNIAFLYIVRAA